MHAARQQGKLPQSRLISGESPDTYIGGDEVEPTESDEIVARALGTAQSQIWDQFFVGPRGGC